MAITKPSNSLAGLVIVHSCDADTTDRSLELDERMCMVVLVAGMGLAALAEICIVADSALEAGAFNVR